MKLYTFYTDSHAEYLCKYFLPSIKDNFELTIYKKPQLSDSGVYMEGGWIDTMLYKVDTIISGIRENIHQHAIFIHSDIDIQFFGPIEPDILATIENYDIAFQKGARSINNGFFACVANEKTLQFWLDVKAYIIKNQVHDERASKALLGLPLDFYDDDNVAFRNFSNKYDLDWCYLPIEKFVGGQYIVESFESQKLTPPPATILMHHATSTLGYENKIRQLEYVRNFVNKE